MVRIKRVLMLILSFIFIVGCNDYKAQTIAFLNSKKVQLFTYKNEYDDFLSIEKYDVFEDINRVSIDDDVKYICIALSPNDYDKNTFYNPSFFNGINNLLNKRNGFFILYGFENEDFLKNTEFDYLQNNDKEGIDYTMHDDSSYVAMFSESYDSYKSTRYTIADEKGTSPFESTVISILHRLTYDRESVL